MIQHGISWHNLDQVRDHRSYIQAVQIHAYNGGPVYLRSLSHVKVAQASSPGLQHDVKDRITLYNIAQHNTVYYSMELFNLSQRNLVWHGTV